MEDIKVIDSQTDTNDLSKVEQQDFPVEKSQSSAESNALEELNDKVNGDIQETVDSEESHSENDQEKS